MAYGSLTSLPYGIATFVKSSTSPQINALTGITAGTTRTQAGATVLTAIYNRVDTATAPASGSVLGDGVVLPPAANGAFLYVVNNTAYPIQVYGNGTDTINGIAAATGVPVPPGDVGDFICVTTGAWSFEGGVGTSGYLPVQLVCNTISAAGNTQATGFALPGDFNRVTTCSVPFTFTGSAATTVLTVSSVTGTPFVVGQYISGGAIPAGTYITSFGTGTGGTGTYNLNQTATQSSTTLTAQANGVVLPAAKQGLDIVLSNKSGSPIQVYGNGTDTIDAIAGSTGVSQMNNSVVFYFCTATGVWETEGLATGYAGNGLQTLQYMDVISAAGNSQATATQMSAALNAVTTATQSQGVNLPAISPGEVVSVTNATSVGIIVYPFQGASTTINGQVATTGVFVQAGTTAQFVATNATNWYAVPNSTNEAAVNSVASNTTLNLTGTNITGGLASVDVLITGAQAGAITVNLPTVANMIAAMHCPTVGSSFRLRIINGGTTQTMTVTTATGWTLNGTLTVTNNTWREFVVSLTSIASATAVATSVATGTYS